MQNKEYLNWVDVFKGLGIILVILGHLKLSHELLNYIYLFHMPLFFFISGYLLKIDGYPNFNKFIKKKTKSLLVPYFALSIISIIFYSVIAQYNVDVLITLQSILEGKRNAIYYNSPLWFLVGLFVVELMYYILKRVVKNDIAILFLTIAINFIAVVVLKVIEKPSWIWSVDTAMYYLLYYQLGHLFRVHQHTINTKKMINKITLSGVIVLCVLLNLILLISPNLISFVPKYITAKNELLFIWLIICATSGIVTYVCLSMVIKKSARLEYIGKNSLIIFALHYPLGILIFDVLKTQLQIDIVQSNLIAIIQLVIILVILKPVVKIINERFHFVLGRGKFFGTDAYRNNLQP